MQIIRYIIFKTGQNAEFKRKMVKIIIQLSGKLNIYPQMLVDKKAHIK